MLLYADEASFRQDPTLYRTWARIGAQPQIPTRGERNTLKIFGTIELYWARFLYHFQPVFNAETYITYLRHVLRSYYPRKIYLIQDNAPYHKDCDVWLWFADHRDRIEVFNLPQYSPELNALEKIWHYIRLHGTHNRYFATQNELRAALRSVFRSIQRNPSQILRYLQPYQ